MVSGFVEVEPSAETPYACPYCEEPRAFRNLSGAKAHLRARHPSEDVPPEWEQVRRDAAPPERAEAAPRIAEPSPDLGQVHTELVESIQSVGALVAGLLGQYKETTALYAWSHRGHSVRLPLLNVPAPYLETTFGHVIHQRAPLSAHILMRYAQQNSTLLALIVAFNKAMHGGEVGSLIFDHAIGLAHTLRPTDRRFEGLAVARVPDALREVLEENQVLRAKIAMMEQQRREEQGAGPEDERGHAPPA